MTLGHTNTCVQDVDAIVKFLQTAFREFRVRGRGKTMSGENTWIHLGTDDPAERND